MSMITADHYKLYGFLMSPYSMKMRAYLRYRRIPFQWVTGEAANNVAMTKVEPYMVPVLGYPDGSYVNDSSHLIDDLESRYSDRSTTPENEADAFLALLIEDYADEWLVAPFFLYRWESEADQTHNAQWIIYEYSRGNIGHDQFDTMAEMWRKRQTSLLSAVSGKPASYDMVKASLHELLATMENAIRKRPFFFGSRPSSAEFAIFGMLSQLVQDLSANRFMRDQYPFTSRWVGVIDDISDFEGTWEPLCDQPERLMNSPVYELLKLSGRYHLPMLLANQRASQNQEKVYCFEVAGVPHERRVLPRFLPCLPALQQHYNALSDSTKATLNPALEDAGCLQFLNVKP